MSVLDSRQQTNQATDPALATPGYPLAADMDVIMDPDGTAVIFDPADDDAWLKSANGIDWLEDWL